MKIVSSEVASPVQISAATDEAFHRLVPSRKKKRDARPDEAIGKAKRIAKLGLPLLSIDNLHDVLSSV